MRAVVQRVVQASVTVDGVVVGAIGQGLVVLLGIHENDTEKQAAWMAEKLCGLRIFSDNEDRLNLSVKDVGGKLLCVSNFTVYGDSAKGKRPNFMAAAKGEKASTLYEAVCALCKEKGVEIEKGSFGADMLVAISNDGPVTLVVDSEDKR